MGIEAVWRDERGAELGRVSDPDFVLSRDPATGKLKSWTFESDGSIGTSKWGRTETGWRADVSSTTGDGELVRAVTIIKPSSRNAFTFESIDRTVDGEKVANIAPVQVTRIKKP